MATERPNQSRTWGRAARRAAEAAHLLTRCAADWATRRRLAAAYLALARNRFDPAVTEGRLRFSHDVFAVRFRERDIYVIGEILHAGLYRIVSPLPPSPVVLDAGANIGVASLWFAARYPGATLTSFEPERENFALLQHNLSQLSRASCVQAALGAREGGATLHVTDKASDHSLLDVEEPSRPQPVRCTTLDAFVAQSGVPRVDLLKLDVEGSELEVLKGMQRCAARVQVITGECHELLVDARAFYECLEALGFRVVARRPARAHEHVHMFEATR